jgi:hypothetical protein
MRSVIEDRIKGLNKEALSLVEQRENMLNLVQELEVRLHQVSGAVEELTKLLDYANDPKDKEDL